MSRAGPRRSGDDAAGALARTDPRADRAQAVAPDVARSILVEEGWDAVTHARVAERSGLHRATTYRHWGAAMDLLRDVLAREAASTNVVPTGDLARDLTAALRRINLELGEGDLRPVLTALIDRAEWDPEISEIKDIVAGFLDAWRTSGLATAKNRGRVRT